MSEYDDMQVLAAAVAKAYLNAGTDKSMVGYITSAVAGFDHKAMLEMFRAGLTELTYKPTTKNAYLVPADLSTPESINIEKIYHRVNAHLQKLLDCKHPRAISQYPYCPDCGTRIGRKSLVAKRNGVAHRNGMAELKK